MLITIKKIGLTSLLLAVAASTAAANQTKRIEMTDDGTVTIESAEIPLPSTFSPEAVAAFKHFVASGGSPVLSGDIYQIRKTYDKEWVTPVYEKWQAMFHTKIKHAVMNGVAVDIVTPKSTKALDKNRVLINLHGGGFHVGGGLGGLIESIPMTGFGGYKVVSVDYRMAPEVTFPAATLDVVAVYEELLKEYSPESIGIYGGSAGGMLTAQVVAHLISQNKPLPGAVSLMCSGAVRVRPSMPIWTLTFTGVETNGAPLPSSLGSASYLSPEDSTNPLAFPVNDKALLKQFPPTLLISSTRDVLMSATLETHKAMLEADVDASLFISDGFGHCFFAQQPGLPESEAVWRVAAKFFATELK